MGEELLSNLKLNNQFALENNSGFNLRPFYLLVLVVDAINENPRQAEIEGAPDCDPLPFIWLLIRVVSLSLGDTECPPPPGCNLYAPCFWASEINLRGETYLC